MIAGNQAIGIEKADHAAQGALISAASALAAAASAKADTALTLNGSASTTKTNDVSALAYFADAAGRILGQIGLDGGWQIALAQLADATGLKLYSYSSNDLALGALVVADQNGRVLWSSADVSPALTAEVTAARGTQPSLTARLDKSLSPSGAPLVASWGKEFMRNCHQRIMSRLLGETQQLVFGAVGDSYFQNASRWVGPFTTLMTSLYGDAGGGWCGFGYFGAGVPGDITSSVINGNARPSTYPVTLSQVAGGAWTAAYNSADSVDLASVTSVTAGDKIVVGAPALPVHNGVDLHFIGTADGVTQYRWNGGSWTTLNVQGTVGALQVVALAGVPAGAFTLEVQVVSGTVTLCGVNLKSAANGVVVHKLGGSGSSIANWSTQCVKTDWKAAMTSLGVHAFIQGECGNSQASGITPTSWKAQLSTLVDSLRASAARPDIMILMPPQHQRTTDTYPVSAYATQAFDLCIEKSLTWRNQQPDFGLLPADYASTAAYPLFNVDGLHPEPISGGRMMVQAAASMVVPY